ncbi:hypothetical protein Rsub_01761 [Raphidocelis subcapitata]|uniref:Uncharacterized protein n=1 Tax=Raphidocelis subcapitata TaxID=307507 RepID=A0A2V0NNC2_9CHLO|nr:hypothetical protein Rsub_01761 [Raphidocelis subcapitata]|eukprot:GBF89044.1 hypothetical protein Rsub_01761 [Raphidocelis subcapitata]
MRASPMPTRALHHGSVKAASPAAGWCGRHRQPAAATLATRAAAWPPHAAAPATGCGAGGADVSGAAAPSAMLWRRGVLSAAAAAAAAPWLGFSRAVAAVGSVAAGLPAIAPALIRPELAPDQSAYDPTDPELRAAAALLQDALAAPGVALEEARWGEVIERYGSLDRNWVPDVVGRAYGNRGNARARQGRLAEALADYGEAARLCPWSVDPVLNRGVALEAMGRFEDAAADYRAVLAAAPDDPSAWNNLGNANAGLGRWGEARECFGRAVALAPAFSFAAANEALALWATGEREPAIRRMRSLLRRYSDFDDVRAALAAALWADGREGDAETMWARVEDSRYRDVVWLKERRRWPPGLVEAMTALLELRSV